MEYKEEIIKGCYFNRISGRLDVVNSEKLEDALMKALNDGHKKVVLDLATLDYISSSGLRTLLLVLKKLNQDKGKLIISNVDPKIMQVFDLSGFTKLFDFASSDDEAIEKLS